MTAARPILCALIFLILGHTVPVHAGERARTDGAMLAGIARVEDWQGRRGAAGEIGPWQMLPATWAAYRGTARQRAETHLIKLRRDLARLGVDPSPFNLALCWNAGLTATVTGRAPEKSYDYARRVVASMEGAK